MITPTTIAEAIAAVLSGNEFIVDGEYANVGSPGSCGCPGCEQYGPDVIFVDGRAYTVAVTAVPQ